VPGSCKNTPPVLSTAPPVVSTTPPVVSTTHTGQPVEVVSVLEPSQIPNPGGPLVEITLKNTGIEFVISLVATVELLFWSVDDPQRYRPFSFDVSPSHPFLPGTSISAQDRIIGGGFSTGLPYDVTVNGTLQDGKAFYFTWKP